MTRVTLDLDDHTHAYTVWTCRVLLEHGAEDVRYRESSSGDGYHVEADVDGGVPIMIRLVLGDDVERSFRETRHKRMGGVITHQFLADEKDGDTAGAWRCPV